MRGLAALRGGTQPGGAGRSPAGGCWPAARRCDSSPSPPAGHASSRAGGAPGPGRRARRRAAAGAPAARCGDPHAASAAGADRPAELTVVVPVRDRPAQLAALPRRDRSGPVRTRRSWWSTTAHAGPSRCARICAARAVALLRHERSRGPAAARNAALAVCATPFVGFVDSDVVLPERAARRLLGHFSDPSVGAVAPRVRGLAPARGAIGDYEARHSALDMGPHGGLVAPGRRVSYVPSAVLFARRGTLGDGFDASMRFGEDVDLVWRLARAGWRVRYAADVDIWHEHRVRLRDFAGARRRYAASLGPLARRHPGAVPAMWVSPGLALPWALALTGHPRAAAAAVALAAVRSRARLRGPVGGLGRGARGRVSGRRGGGARTGCHGPRPRLRNPRGPGPRRWWRRPGAGHGSVPRCWRHSPCRWSRTPRRRVICECSPRMRHCGCWPSSWPSPARGRVACADARCARCCPRAGTPTR